MDRAILEDLVIEARGYEWAARLVTEIDGHTHCMICGAALSPLDDPAGIAHRSAGGWLCTYCHGRFVHSAARP